MPNNPDLCRLPAEIVKGKTSTLNPSYSLRDAALLAIDNGSNTTSDKITHLIANLDPYITTVKLVRRRKR